MLTTRQAIKAKVELIRKFWLLLSALNLAMMAMPSALAPELRALQQASGVVLVEPETVTLWNIVSMVSLAAWVYAKAKKMKLVGSPNHARMNGKDKEIAQLTELLLAKTNAFQAALRNRNTNLQAARRNRNISEKQLNTERTKVRFLNEWILKLRDAANRTDKNTMSKNQEIARLRKLSSELDDRLTSVAFHI